MDHTPSNYTPNRFPFFCKGWNSLSAGSVKQIVFPKNLRRRFYFSQAFKKKVQGGTLRTYGQVGMEWPVGGFHGFKTFEKLKGGISPVLRVEAWCLPLDLCMMASPWPRSDSTLDLEDLVRMAKTAWLRTIYVRHVKSMLADANQPLSNASCARPLWEEFGNRQNSHDAVVVCSGQPLRYPSSARISSWARGGNFLAIKGPHCKVPKGLVPAYCGLPGRRESTRAGRGRCQWWLMVVIHALILSKCHKCEKCLKLWFGKICDLCTLDIQITQTFFFAATCNCWNPTTSMPKLGFWGCRCRHSSRHIWSPIKMLQKVGNVEVWCDASTVALILHLPGSS